MNIHPGEARRNPALKVILVSVCVSLVIALLALYRFWRMIAIDYSQRPAAEVFRVVLNQPVPSGVRNLRIAGHGVLMQHTVWMKFTATDGAIERILKGPALVVGSREASLSGEVKARAAVDDDARAINWDSVLHSSRNDAYKFSFPTGGSGWFGDIVVNRDGHEVYVVADVL